MANLLPWPHRAWTGEREQAWCKLEQWLKLNYCGDVLMPAPLGEKRPAYTHAAGSWTWARYDWICRTRTALQAKDIGILLRDICVIDVDTVADADALEARFPELCTAPAEATARGRHYFFSRSAMADEKGYYDGAAQKMPTVDFKTRAWGGGSGFVIVAPSTNKSWLRAPWEVCPSGELPIISDALLDAVAAPRHAPLRVALRFLASGSAPTVEHVSTLLPTCSYVITALEVGNEESTLSAALSAVTLDDAGAPAAMPELLIPEQFAADVFFDLERVAAGHDPDIGDVKEPHAWLADAAAYDAHMAEIVALADFLGVPEAKMVTIRAAGAGGSRNRGLWLNINRPWALNCMDAARDALAGKLVAVDAALSAALKHEQLLPNAPHDHRWVLHDGPRSREGVAAGALVLADDPAAAAASALPAFVLQALRSEAGHLALAGGAALSAVTPRELATSSCDVADYDLFAYGFIGNADAVSASADALVRRIATIPGVMRGSRGAMVSRHAITFRVFKDDGDDDDGDGDGEFVVQIILRVAKDPADILGGFDLSPSKVCILYETSTAEQLTVLAAPEWPLAMRHGAYALDGRAWSRATSLRVFKYAAKGFDALVPALTDRSKLRYRLNKNPKSWWSGREKLAHLDGFELVYALERSISKEIERETTMRRSWLAYRRLQPRTSKRITPKDVEIAARQLYLEQRTDYASALKTLRTLSYAMSFAYQKLLQSFGIVAVPDALSKPLGWRQPWSRAQFHPVVADVVDSLSLVDTPAS